MSIIIGKDINSSLKLLLGVSGEPNPHSMLIAAGHAYGYTPAHALCASAESIATSVEEKVLNASERDMFATCKVARSILEELIKLSDLLLTLSRDFYSAAREIKSLTCSRHPNYTSQAFSILRHMHNLCCIREIDEYYANYVASRIYSAKTECLDSLLKASQSPKKIAEHSAAAFIALMEALADRMPSIITLQNSLKEIRDKGIKQFEAISVKCLP